MTETVKLQVTADASKVSPELAKVQKDLGDLAKSTKRIEEGLGKFGDRLKQAFSLGAITAFMLKVNNAADQLNDLSDRLGASASGLQAIQLAAAQAGGSAEAASNALAKMSSTIGDAMAGNKQASEAFSRLGLSVQQLSTMKADEAFRAISDALARVPNSFERASLAQDVFGKGAKEIAGLLAQGGAAIDEVNKRLAEQGALLSDLDVKKIGVMNDELQFQSTVVQNLGTKFLSGLSPAVGVATGAVAEMLGRLGGATEAGKLFGTVMVGAIKVVEATAYTLAAAFEGVRAVIAGVLYAITSGIQNVLQGSAYLAEQLGLDIAGPLRSASDTMDGIADSMGDVAKKAYENAVQAGSYAIEAAFNIVKAGEIFNAAQAEFERKAREAADRNKGPQGAGSGSGEFDPTKGLKANPFGGIDAASNKTLDKALGKFDPTTDLEALFAEDRFRWLEEREKQHQADRLGWLGVFNDTWLGQMLAAGQTQVDAETFKNQTIGDLMGGLVGAAIQQGGALGKHSKALAIAQTVWAGATAVIETFKNAGGYPFGIAPAAIMAGTVAMQLANIKKTNVGSGGSGVSSSAGGGSVAAPSLPSSVPATTPTSTESDRKSASQIIIQGPILSGQQSADWLIDILRQATDADMVFMTGNSRQAMEIRGG